MRRKSRPANITKVVWEEERPFIPLNVEADMRIAEIGIGPIIQNRVFLRIRGNRLIMSLTPRYDSDGVLIEPFLFRHDDYRSDSLIELDGDLVSMISE